MELKPLAQNLIERIFPMIVEYEEALRVEIENHKQAILAFKALKGGEASLSDLVVTDNGWELMPPAPSMDVVDAAT